MERYIGDIIADCRRDTREDADIPTPTNLVGVQDADFLRYANFAQQRLQGKITKKFPFVFEKKAYIDVVADQAQYTISDNLYMGTRIRQVRYSVTGDAKDYKRLVPNNPYSTYSGSGYPRMYNRSNGVITVEPVPNVTRGKLEVTFERTLDKMDLRRGQVTARTLSSTQLTALTLSITGDDVTALQSGSAQYLCVNDKYGNVNMYNIPFTSYDSGTGVVTLPAFTFQTGETVNVGDYVTIGRWTTTHSKLVDDAERYLVEYINRRIFKKGSSSDALLVDEELKEIEEDIVASYEIPDKDIKNISVVDYEMLVWDEGWE